MGKSKAVKEGGTRECSQIHGEPKIDKRAECRNKILTLRTNFRKKLSKLKPTVVEETFFVELCQMALEDARFTYKAVVCELETYARHSPISAGPIFVRLLEEILLACRVKLNAALLRQRIVERLSMIFHNLFLHCTNHEAITSIVRTWDPREILPKTTVEELIQLADPSDRRHVALEWTWITRKVAPNEEAGMNKTKVDYDSGDDSHKPQETSVSEPATDGIDFSDHIWKPDESCDRIPSPPIPLVVRRFCRPYPCLDPLYLLDQLSDDE